MQEYKFKDATLLVHGRDYLKAAVLLYEKREINYFPYPVLTLSAFSIEMFFKGFYSVPNDRNIPENDSRRSSVVRHTVKVDIKIHSFSQLFEKFEEDHELLANYLKTEYLKIYDTDIVEDLKLYSDIFVESRYAYEYPHFTNATETKYAAQVANSEAENAENEAKQAQIKVIKAEVKDRKELEEQARQAKNSAKKAKQKAEKASKKQFESLEAMMGNLLKISQFLYNTFDEFVQKQPITPEQQVWDSYIEQRRKNR